MDEGRVEQDGERRYLGVGERRRVPGLELPGSQQPPVGQVMADPDGKARKPEVLRVGGVFPLQPVDPVEELDQADGRYGYRRPAVTRFVQEGRDSFEAGLAPILQDNMGISEAFLVNARRRP